MRSRQRKTARGALRRVEGRDYDAIIVDHQMPRMTGLEFLERLRGDRSARFPAVRDTPVIVVTAYGTIEMAVQGHAQRGLQFFDEAHLL